MADYQEYRRRVLHRRWRRRFMAAGLLLQADKLSVAAMAALMARRGVKRICIRFSS